MNHGSHWLKDAIALAFALVAGLVAKIPEAVFGLVFLMALDIVSGVVAGGRRGELSSKVSTAGLRRKLNIILLVLAVAVLEHFAGLQLPFSLVTVVSLFYCANEMLSIIENAAEAGLPIPAVLRRVLAKLNEEVDAAEARGRE